MPPFPLSRVRWQVIPKSVKNFPLSPLILPYCLVDSLFILQTGWLQWISCLIMAGPLHGSFSCFLSLRRAEPFTLAQPQELFQASRAFISMAMKRMFWSFSPRRTSVPPSAVSCCFPTAGKKDQWSKVHGLRCFMLNVKHQPFGTHTPNSILPSTKLSFTKFIQVCYPPQAESRRAFPSMKIPPKWVNAWTLTCYVGNSNRISWNKKNMRT